MPLRRCFPTGLEEIRPEARKGCPEPCDICRKEDEMTTSIHSFETIVDPSEIERRSMSIIDSEVPEPRPYQGKEWEVVRRMIHTTADFDLLSRVRFHPKAIEAGQQALNDGCTILTDTQMARAGMSAWRLDLLGVRVISLVNDPRVAEEAKARGVSRSIAAIDASMEESGIRIYAIGNAPTALIRLSEHMEAGRMTPDLIVGMPVGFVNAAESKELLVQRELAPYIVIDGRKGGSALCAAVINALAEIILRERHEARIDRGERLL
jgi:precorrin-8X/cobalt-precorrin-8 methylmutase